MVDRGGRLETFHDSSHTVAVAYRIYKNWVILYYM